jgi:hypothetical protein
MSSPYDVTVPSTSLAVQDNKGRATFTVKNATDRPLATRIDVDVEPPGRPEWVKADWVQRTIGPGVSEQVVATVEAPPEAEGQFNFRVIAVSLDRPEEDKTPSPATSVALRKRAVPKPGPRIPWWVFLIIGVALLAIVIVVIALVTGGGEEKRDDGLLELPCVVGRPFRDARADLERRGFRVEPPIPTTEGPQPRGEVVRQSPNECPPRPNRYRPGTPVTLTVHR